MERSARVYRIPRGRGGVLTGLCAGIAEHLGIDPLVVRFGVALLCFVPVGGLAAILLYFLFSLYTPVKP
jgi:phage shock protein PspC (stress-responsive transcriptional regulator)